MDRQGTCIRHVINEAKIATLTFDRAVNTVRINCSHMHICPAFSAPIDLRTAQYLTHLDTDMDVLLPNARLLPDDSPSFPALHSIAVNDTLTNILALLQQSPNVRTLNFTPHVLTHNGTPLISPNNTGTQLPKTTPSAAISWAEVDVRKVVARADVVVKNFLPRKLASMGLAYGQRCPYHAAAGYNVIVEVKVGLIHITGEPNRPPSKVGLATTNINTGLYAHSAIMAALPSRQQTGEGVWIDCNLFETQIAGLENIASNYLIAGIEVKRHGTTHPSVVPYQPGEQQAVWDTGRVVSGGPALMTDVRFATNRAHVANHADLVCIIKKALMQHDHEHWLERLTGLRVPFGPINNIQQTFAYSQTVARSPVRGTVKLIAPVVFHNGEKKVTRPLPWMSEHMEEVMQELEYSAERVGEPCGHGVI
ncbi:CoA-transferase family III domain-containing protein [Mycena crocata]|nr:CoA-transferase family III domain-containing protein [Mycena crocata]